MGDYEYDTLLNRARDRIPTDISERNRWTMPNPEILVEGNQTIIRNFSAIVDAMDRDANHVYQYLINELGTSGTREQIRVMLKGRIPPKRIKEKIVGYVKTYILCDQCMSPILVSSRKVVPPCLSARHAVLPDRFVFESNRVYFL